jgi:hypothetical protein
VRFNNLVKEMEMNRNLLLSVVALLLMQSQAFSQSQPHDLPKFEVAGEFTTIEREDIGGRRTEPGFGGRFTYNINEVFSLEAAGYFFPKDCFICRNAGTITEGLGGVKVGKRFEKWGIFAKARPGVISYSEGTFDQFPVFFGPVFPIVFERKRLTTFAMDVGGVVEFYPSKRIVTRFDVGDTIVHFKRHSFDTVLFNSLDNSFTNVRLTTPARTTNNFQFMASVGFRF